MSHQEIHLWVSVRGLFSRAQWHKKWTGGLSATLQRGPDAPGLVRWSLELVLLGLQPVLRDSLTLQDTRHSPTHICLLCFVRQHMECGLTSTSPQHAHSHTPHGVSSSGRQSSGATDHLLARPHSLVQSSATAQIPQGGCTQPTLPLLSAGDLSPLRIH